MLIVVVFFLCSLCPGFTDGDLRPPRITSLSSPSNLIKLQTNQVLTLTCQATGQEPLEYRWQHDGVTIIPKKVDRISTYMGTIVIGSLHPGDEGAYRCVVSNPLGVVFSEDIVVQFSYVNDFVVPDTDANVKTVRAKLGLPLQLDCPEYKKVNKVKHYWGTVNPNDGTMSLLPVGNRVTVDATGNLVFSWLKQADVDTIKSKEGISCIIGNNDNTKVRVSHRYMINVTDDAPILEVRPQIAEQLLSDYDVAEDESLRLRCSATGRPTPSLTWFKNGRRITSGGGYSIEDSGRVLVLRPVEESMRAEYKCVAQSTYIGETRQASSSTTVHVKSKPAWLRKPNKNQTEAFLSKTYQLECKASGSPTPTYTWYKNVRKLNTYSSKYRVVGYKLHVHKLTDSDKGVYQCSAENKYGTIIAAQYLNIVAMPPSFKDVKFGPFKMYMGLKAVLRCDPEAAPRPRKSQKTWAKNGKVITYDGTKYMQNSYGDLVILDVSSEDAANYTCLVETVAGRTQATASAIISTESPGSDGCSLHAVVWMSSILNYFFVLAVTQWLN